MPRVHLRDYERNVPRHAVVLGVAEHDRSGCREGGFDVTRDRGVECREDDLRPKLLGRARRHHHVRDVFGRCVSVPSHSVTVWPARRTVGRGDLSQLEQRMAVQEPDERLAHGSGRAQHRDGNARRL